MVAYYSGDNECAVNQNVYLTFIRNGSIIDKIKIGNGTGNPVIWEEQDNIVLLYSKFEDNISCNHLADKWKHCSLWTQAFNVFNDKIYFTSIPQRLSSFNDHLLGRCRPIIYDSKLILPLYDELERVNIIYAGLFPDYRLVSSYGDDMIQPTLWAMNGQLHSLSRNFNKTNHLCRYNMSTDCANWSENREISIYNKNSSCHALTVGDDNFVIWNDNDSYERINLSLGLIHHDLTISKIMMIDKYYGSYPSVSVKDDSIVVSYSAYDRSIAIREYNRGQIKGEYAQVGADLL
jgi:hypothetical protein